MKAEEEESRSDTREAISSEQVMEQPSSSHEKYAYVPVSCGWQNDLPKDVHALIPGTCYMAKRDFADVIRVTDLQLGRLSWIIQVSTV